MLFNSIDFAIFLPLVFLIYWFVTGKNLKIQNLFILAASYVFYAWWDWRFLSLIAFSTVLDYFIGQFLLKTEEQKKRKILLWISITVNLSFLGVFKYFNFFADTFVQAFSLFGREIRVESLKVILPVGISFYTFQTLSYSIDVYKRKLVPTKDFVAFASFVAFFPQLVAGPIERAVNLLPQFFVKRKFDYNSAVDGLRQMLWGFFKKMVIADRCAEYANQIFNNSDQYSGLVLFMGAVFFAFQIYGDFSGYSDIAIGVSRLFGFNLKRNFAFPYFSRDIAEFWRRWHISLSTWFRDYVYISLGGNRGSKIMQIRNILIVFIVSGFWHGANWTFICWGLVNALFFLPLMLTKKNRNHLDIVAAGSVLPGFGDFLRISFTFIITTLAWVFFRAENMSHAFSYLSGIFSPSILTYTPFDDSWRILMTIGLILFFVVFEWIGRRGEYAIEKLFFGYNRFVRLGFYYLILILIFVSGGTQQTFIYFQF